MSNAIDYNSGYGVFYTTFIVQKGKTLIEFPKSDETGS